MLNLYSMLYEDGDYGFYFCRVSSWYMRLAKVYGNEGDTDATIDCLVKSAKYCVIYDTAPNSKHTSFMVNRLVYNSEDSAKDYTENDSSLRLNDLKNNCFDFIRGDNRFIAIETKLKKVII